MSTTLNDDYPKKNVELSDAALKAKAIAQFEAQQVIDKVQPQTSKFPTEIIQLPSKGKFYPEGHPLRSGTIEMKYMTAKEEDILTNQSYIKQGVVLDKLFKSLIVTPFDYNDLLVGDKNAVMIAARVLGYGKDYDVEVVAPSGVKQKVHVDLTQLEDKEIDWEAADNGDSYYELELPASKRTVTVQLVTQGMQRKIDEEMKALTKIKKDATVTTMLKHLISSIDSDTDPKAIRHFVDNELFAIDSRYIRNELKKITPDINLEIDCIDEETGEPFRCPVTIGLDFFWPDSKV
jgi:hypothetical protein